MPVRAGLRYLVSGAETLDECYATLCVDWQLNRLFGFYKGGSHIAIQPLDGDGDVVHGVENRIAIITEA